MEEEQATKKARDLLLSIHNGNYAAYAPEIQKYELGNVIHKGKQVSQDKITEYIEFIESFPITYIPENSEIMSITHEMCYKYNISYYDASYISVATALKGTCITADKKLVQAINNHDICTDISQIQTQ